MSQENVEIVRRHIAAWGAGEAALALSFLDPHIVLDVTRTGEIEGAFYRAEGVVEHFRRYAGTFDDYRWEVRRLDDLGTGAVLALVTQSGRGKGSGASVAAPWPPSTPLSTPRSFGSPCFRANGRPSKPPGCRSSSVT